MKKIIHYLLLIFIIINVIIFISNNAQAQYCASVCNSVADEEIKNVTLGTLNNNSDCAIVAGGPGSILSRYANYVGTGVNIPNLVQGSNVPFSVIIGSCGTYNYSSGLAIFIDFNQDNDFVDAGEKVYSNGTAANIACVPQTTVSGNIPVACASTLGLTRMRVINVENMAGNSIGPCQNGYGYGETEDYSVNITAGPPATYTSSTVSQIATGNVSQCGSQPIISIPVVVGSGCSNATLTQFVLGAGTSANYLANVSKIHIYFTGTNSIFSQSNEFVPGGTVPVASTNTISGNQMLTPGATNYFWVAYDLMGPIGNTIDGTCTQITFGGSNYTPTVTNPAGNGIIIACPCGFTLANDTSICSPSSYTIQGPTGYSSYLWTPGGATSQNLNVTTTGTYSCTASNLSGDLVVNGNFSAGNTGYTTSYSGPLGGSWGPLSYENTHMISTNPQLTHSNFMSFGDHTTGTGNMMVVNGSGTANAVVWSQTITVTPGTTYNFSAWVASTLANMPANEVAQLQFSINGSLIGPVVFAPTTGGVWINFFVTWNSGINTSAVITIVDQNTLGSGNDFALDDIFFQEICTCTDNINVTIKPKPTITPSSSPSTICNGLSTSLSANSNVTGTTFSWMPGSLTGSPVSVNPASNTTYTVTGTAAGCSGSSTLSITVNPNPIVSPTATPTAICSGGSSSLSANSTVNGTTFSWMPGSLAGSTVTVIPTTSTTYTVTGTAAGCSGSTTVSVMVNPIPVVTPSAIPGSICSGETCTLSASSTVTGTNYNWNPGNMNGSPVSVNPATTSTYTVIGSAAGCTSSASVSVTINPNPVINPSASPPSICIGELCSLTASSDVAGTSFNWMPGSLSGNPVSVNPSSNTTYTVTGTAVGCTGSATLNVTIKPDPIISPTAIPPAICEGTSSSLSATSSVLGTTYSWEPGNLNGNPISVDPLNSTTYTVTGTSAGCTGSATLSLTVNSNPVVSISTTSELPVCIGNLIFLQASGANSYTWNSGITTNPLEISFENTTIVTVYGEAHGCWDTANIEIPVTICDLTIPNVITPNNDLINDNFVIDGIEHFAINSVQIFNRWGKLIFERDSYQNNWNGEGYADGTYYYIVNVKNNSIEKSFSGSLTILR